MGYSRQHNLVVAVWLGSGDGQSAIRSADLRRAIGGNLAAQVFAQVMHLSISAQSRR